MGGPKFVYPQLGEGPGPFVKMGFFLFLCSGRLLSQPLFHAYAGNVFPRVSCPSGNNSKPTKNASAVMATGFPIVW